MIKRSESDDEARRGAFATMVAHELRTPLTAAYGALEMMSRAAATSSAADAARNAVLIDLAHRNTQRLLRIVEDCLDLEAASDGRLSLVPGSILASDLSAVGIAGAAMTREQTGIEIVSRFDAELRVAGDVTRLGRALTHLVQNAVTFAPRGTVVTVTTELLHQVGTVRFTVEDLGAGIAPDRLATLFQRFDVRHTAGRHRVGGMGMGLAFVKAVAEAHGGSAGAESLPGRTAVWFEVPAIRE